MKTRLYRTFMMFIVFLLSTVPGLAQTQSKGITFQGVIKTPNGQFPTVSGTSVLVKLLSPNDCILREESFSSVNIANGYLNLVVGKGTPTANNPSPARDLKAVLNNSVSLSGLTCLNPDGSVNGVTTAYAPQVGDIRKLRITLQIEQDTVVADFNIRAVAYAVNAETLNGKAENNFLNVNSVSGLTQANAESVFQRFTQLDSLLNGNFTGTLTGNVSGTAQNVTGVVGLANGGTGASTAEGARTALGLKGLAVVDLPSPVDPSKFLRGDGQWASVVGGVASVNGHSGVVVLTTADLADFNSAADARALGQINALKGAVNGLASLDANGKVPSTQLALTSADIPSLDASKVNAGTLSVPVNSASVSGGVGQFTQMKIYDGVSKSLTMSLPTGGSGYSLQWPANVGSAGDVLQTDASGVLSWVAIPSAPVTSVAGRTGAVILSKADVSGLGTAAALNEGTAPGNLVQLDAGAKVPDILLSSSVLTSATVAGGDLSGTYPNPTVANSAITGGKLADGAAGSLSKVVNAPGSAGPNRLLATDTGAGTSIKDFFCTTVGYYLKWTVTGFGCAPISSADIADASSANDPSTVIKRDPSGNFSAGTVTANLNGNVIGNLSGNVTGKLSGSVQANIAKKTANYSIQDGDGILTGDATSGSINFVLPSAVGMAGRQYTIKKIDASSNTLLITTSSSQTIDGSDRATLSSRWQHVTVTSDGANWLITNSTGADATASIQFAFTDVTNVVPGSVVKANAVTTTGTGSHTVIVTGAGSPQISINGGSWVTSGTIVAGQTLEVRMTSSSSTLTTQTATIFTVGGFSTNWTVTTDSTVVIVANGSTRNYSNGTYASSCNKYLNPNAGYSYTGVTGDGVYRISAGGNTYDVYCNMTANGGGWTLVGKNAYQSRANASSAAVNWPLTTYSINDDDVGAGKFSDAITDAIATTKKVYLLAPLTGKNIQFTFSGTYIYTWSGMGVTGLTSTFFTSWSGTVDQGTDGWFLRGGPSDGQVVGMGAGHGYCGGTSTNNGPGTQTNINTCAGNGQAWYRFLWYVK